MAIADRYSRVQLVRATEAGRSALLVLRSPATTDDADDIDQLPARVVRSRLAALSRTRGNQAGLWIAYALRRPGAIPLGHAWRVAILATLTWLVMLPGRAYRTARRVAGRILRRLGLRG